MPTEPEASPGAGGAGEGAAHATRDDGSRAPTPHVANAPIASAELPAHADVPLEPVSGRYVWHRAGGQLLGWWIAAAGLALAPIPADVTVLGAAWTPPALAILGVLAAILAWADARRRAFALRERDLIYERGLLVRKTTLIPVARIQHVETTSGPVERAMGLERVTCFTAGGAGGDVVIRGLERERAWRVRDYVLARIDARRNHQDSSSGPDSSRGPHAPGGALARDEYDEGGARAAEAEPGEAAPEPGSADEGGVAPGGSREAAPEPGSADDGSVAPGGSREAERSGDGNPV